jgi:hypothetical protein
MYYSKRSLENFRTQSKNSYKAGYAESTDGIKWIRKDYLLNIPLSEEGWDSEMIAYPYLIKIKGRWVMFYNGNSFGKTGFGYAVLSK